MKYELRKVFLEKYPKYEIILRMYEEANGCECTFESLSKIRLQKFIDCPEGLPKVRQGNTLQSLRPY